MIPVVVHTHVEVPPVELEQPVASHDAESSGDNDQQFLLELARRADAAANSAETAESDELDRLSQAAAVVAATLISTDQVLDAVASEQLRRRRTKKSSEEDSPE